MTEDMLSWLRREVEADKAAAETAEAVSPGPWVNTGQDGYGGAWQIHGAPTGETKPNWENLNGPEIPILSQVATLNYDDGGGVWEREAADHIVLQQPLDTIARCTAELALLDDYAEAKAYYDKHLSAPAGELHGLYSAIKRIASGYQHRPGYSPAWAPEGTTA